MKTAPYLTTLISTLLLTTPVMALEISNTNEEALTIIVTEEQGETSHDIKAGETLKDICMAGCSVKLPNGEEFSFTGTEVATIEGEFIYDDSPAQGDGAENPPADSENEAEAKDNSQTEESK